MLTIETIKNDYILYLGVPYSRDPDKSVKYSLEATKKLVEAGFTVFSPILHTHFFHLHFGKPANIDYVKWDLNILGHFYTHSVILTFPTADFNLIKNSSGCMAEFNMAKHIGLPIISIADLLENRIVMIEGLF